MAMCYYKNWLEVGKVLLGILIGFGSLVFGFIFYMFLTSGQAETAITRGESPPQRFDLIMIAPIFSLLFLIVSLLYFYRFKTKDTTNIEKCFSIILTGLSVVAIVLSYFIKINF